ncbi:MAG: hypothetical protein OHK0015_52800 [Chloroflexi bacterium OHK40]
MKAIVTGMIATNALAGVAWDYGQYALGLEHMGFEVYYLEDTGVPAYSYNPATNSYDDDPRDGVAFLQRALASLSPTLAQRWHYRASDDRTFGLEPAAIAEVAAEADLFLNVSGCTLLRDAYRRCRRAVLIDTDPGWNHFVIFPRWDAKPAVERRWGWRAHDYFFTYALRLGKPGCPLPTYGYRWHPTVPPVVLHCWQARPPAQGWSTVMSWNNYDTPITHGGITYGSKDVEFARIELLPQFAQGSFELLINSAGAPPVERWRALGWSVRDARAISASLEAYRDYIERARGELSVAKNVYVATASGWFSCRSVCYLAAGLPVIVQDTGFSEVLPVGEGLLTFNNLTSAAAAVATVERDYARHRAAAYGQARRFDAQLVLAEILSVIGMG